MLNFCKLLTVIWKKKNKFKCDSIRSEIKFLCPNNKFSLVYKYANANLNLDMDILNCG